MAIKNSISNNFQFTFVDRINVLDGHLPGVLLLIIKRPTQEEAKMWLKKLYIKM